MDLDRGSFDEGSVWMPEEPAEGVICDDGALPPAPPNEGPERRGQAEDRWLTRSPWWLIPVAVSAVLGVERALLFAFSPGDMEFAMIGWGLVLAVSLAGALLWGALWMDRAQRADREGR
jgi:hypothetical protein